MTTTPDFRALCAELVDSLENARRIIQGGDGTLHINTAEFVLRRANTALSTPLPEPPTELPTLLTAALKLREENDLSRLFLPKLTPPPAPPTDDELNALWNCCGDHDEEGDHYGNIFQFARAAIKRWGGK